MGEVSIKTKQCSICGEEKELNEYYSYDKFRVNGDKYIYYNPYCKDCNKKKSYKWTNENIDRYKQSAKKYKHKPESKKNNRNYNKKYRDSGKQKEWYSNNKDKLPQYRENHRDHDITDQEWYDCLDYFNNTCAYCGLTLENQLNTYNEQFHKEHVIHDGSNYVDNCVPACTKCNTSKHKSEFNDWYNENNEVFSKRRLNKIISWMTKECFKVLNLN